MTIFEKLTLIWEEGYNWGLAQGVKAYASDDYPFNTKYVFIALSKKTITAIFNDVMAARVAVPKDFMYDLTALTKDGELNQYLNQANDVTYYVDKDGIMNFAKIKKRTWLGNTYFMMPIIIDEGIAYGKVRYRVKDFTQ